MNCPHCNTRIPDEALFCPNCGKAVSDTQTDKTATAEVLRTDETATAGIVADSVPKLEYEECCNKAKALMKTIVEEEKMYDIANR